MAASQPPPQIDQRGVATFKQRAEGVVRKVNHSAWCLHTAVWELQFADEACEVLVVRERVVNVVAFFDGAPVRKLQCSFLFALFWAIIEPAVLGGEKKEKRGSEVPAPHRIRFVYKSGGVHGMDVARVPPRSKSPQGESRRHTGR
jgi:hypothetical protein